MGKITLFNVELRYMVKDIYIHVGLPKTATTFLQESLKKIKKELIKKRIYYFNTKNIHNINTKVGQNIKKILISLELYSQPRGFNKFINILNSLKKLYPKSNIHILLSFREQVSLIESLYTQKIKEGSPTNTNNIYEFINKDLDKHLLLDYNKLIDFYLQVGIQQNFVHTYWFENLVIKGHNHYFNWFKTIIGINNILNIPKVDTAHSFNRGLTKNQVETHKDTIDTTTRHTLETTNKNKFLYRKGFLDQLTISEIRTLCKNTNLELGMPLEIVQQLDPSYT